MREYGREGGKNYDKLTPSVWDKSEDEEDEPLFDLFILFYFYQITLLNMIYINTHFIHK